MAALAILAGCALAQHPPPAPPRHTSLGLSLSSLTLRDGLRVVVVQDPHAHQVQVTMAYQVGFVDDPAGQEGMAHLVEHLMFQQVLGSESIFAKLEHDATYFNASTGLDTTTYVSRALPDRLPELLTIEGIRMGLRCTSISDPTFTRERQVVLDELHLRAAADELQAAMFAGLFPQGHPYVRRVDDDTTVGSITRDQACAFADAHYGPANAVLVVSGPVSQAQVEAALGTYLAHLPPHDVAAPAAVPAAIARGGSVRVHAPVDASTLLVAWPLPADPMQRERMLALEPGLFAAIDGSVAGQVEPLPQYRELRAPLLAYLVEVRRGEKVDDVLDELQRGVSQLATGLSGGAGFDVLQQRAIHALYAELQDGSERDERLAATALEGEDPASALDAMVRGLRELTPATARAIAQGWLGLDHATVVELDPSGPERGGRPAIAAEIHDVGQHRDPADPAEAARPADAVLPALPATIRARTLPNGLRVVLVPITSVPTVDVRLTFAAGTADERADHRGEALLAANALTWDLHDLEDEVLFLRAGGSLDKDAGLDTTTFAVQGLDMHLDLLLSGLRRLVVDGTYKVGGKAVAYMLHRYAKYGREDDGPLTDAWRRALYGAGHPYAAAGLVRRVSSTLSVADARQFRAAHYQPDDATLVIAGRFDPDLADRWIDYLFAGWRGHAVPRATAPVQAEPASIGELDDTAVAELRLALPASAGTRAMRLVAAEMLDEIAEDVRHQLAASYAISAGLHEHRLASDYMVHGAVETGRTADALQLVRDRLRQLHDDPDAAARAFVEARRRVLVRLGAITGDASLLAAQVARDLAMDRPPLSDLATAAEVERLTWPAMAPVLADLDLAHAAVLVRGPRAAVDAGFAALGRTPQLVAAAPAPPPAPEHDRLPDDLFDFEIPQEFDRALSEQGPATDVGVTAAAGYLTTGYINRNGADGPAASLDIGVHTDATTTVGLHGAIASISGTEVVGAGVQPYSATPIDIAAQVSVTAYDRLWGGLFLGVHLDDLAEMATSSWTGGLGAGLDGGVDLVKLGHERLGVFALLEGELGGGEGYSGAMLGIALRR